MLPLSARAPSLPPRIAFIFNTRQRQTRCTAQKCEFGNEAGRWFTVAIKPGGLTRRIGYCARGCPGHESGDAALTHHLQFQLDRETDLWLQRHQAHACEIRDKPSLVSRLCSVMGLVTERDSHYEAVQARSGVV